MKARWRSSGSTDGVASAFDVFRLLVVEPDAGDVVGTAGNETLTGTPGDDRIFGAGGATNDSLTIDYSGSPQAIAIDLLRATAEGGHAEGDVLVLINVIISTDFDDVLLADSSVTELRGGPGNDVLAAPSDNGVIVPILTLIGGTGGDDQLLSGDGDDLLIEDADLGTLDAGPGSDLLVAVASAAGTSAVLTGGDDDDLFIIATDLDGGASLTSPRRSPISIRGPIGSICPTFATPTAQSWIWPTFWSTRRWPTATR